MIDEKDITSWFAISGKARIVLDAEFVPSKKYTITVEWLDKGDWKQLKTASGKSLGEAIQNLNKEDDES